MKRTYMCLFVDDGGEGGIAAFAPDIPSCGSAGDNMEHAREMIRECMDFMSGGRSRRQRDSPRAEDVHVGRSNRVVSGAHELRT